MSVKTTLKVSAEGLRLSYDTSKSCTLTNVDTKVRCLYTGDWFVHDFFI